MPLDPFGISGDRLRVRRPPRCGGHEDVGFVSWRPVIEFMFCGWESLAVGAMPLQ